MVELTDAQMQDFNKMNHEFNKTVTDDAQPVVNTTESSEKVKRDTKDNETMDVNEVTTMEANVTTSGEFTDKLANDSAQ